MGFPVTFSIQAGHDVAFYVTSDPIDGNATSQDSSGLICAGGPGIKGIPASATELSFGCLIGIRPTKFYQQPFYRKNIIYGGN